MSKTEHQTIFAIFLIIIFLVTAYGIGTEIKGLRQRLDKLERSIPDQ